MCIFMYVYMWVYIYVCIYASVCVYIYIYIYAHIGVCMYFLKLINKHFKHNILHKIFNRKMLKISYSCMKNIFQIIIIKR